jgi:hypothetical protein
VDMQGEIFSMGVPSYLLQPPSRDRPDAVGPEADLNQRMSFRPFPEIVYPLKERLHGLVPKAREAVPRVGDRYQEEPDARIFGCQGYGLRQGVGIFVRRSFRTVVDIVELGDARVSGGEHLPVATAADLAYGVGVQPPGQGVHPLSPGPEVIPGLGRFDLLDSTPQPSLKGVTVIVDETGGERPSW